MQDSTHAIGYSGAIFIVIVVLIGHYVIEEIFVVILLGNLEFDDSDDGSPIIGIWMANIL